MGGDKTFTVADLWSSRWLTAKCMADHNENKRKIRTDTVFDWIKCVSCFFLPFLLGVILGTDRDDERALLIFFGILYIFVCTIVIAVTTEGNTEKEFHRVANEIESRVAFDIKDYSSFDYIDRTLQRILPGDAMVVAGAVSRYRFKYENTDIWKFLISKKEQ